MRKRIITARIAAAGAAGALLLTVGAGAASAATRSDTTGVAGYYKNADGSWRYRDVKVTLKVTANMEQLGNTTPPNGSVGVRQCNPNTTYAVDNGVIWDAVAGKFEAAYGYGAVTGSGDPCVTAPEAASGPIAFAGNVNAFGISIGDSITVESYYNPSSHWESLSVRDNTTDEQSNQSIHVGYQNFYEAGVGVLDTLNTGLVPPVSNLLTTFTGARVTVYSAKSSGTSLNGGGETVPVSALNGSQVVVVTPSGLNGAGNVFSVSAGVS